MSERTPNEEQIRVINETERNIILFASAGTGKTFSVAKRVNHILESSLAAPDDILCLTFTTKAAGEMKSDILEYAGEKGKGVTVSTIHSFCYQVLREEAKKSSSVYSDPVVIDDADADSALKEALKDLDFKDEDVMNSTDVLYQIISPLKKGRELNGPYTMNETADFQAVWNRIERESIDRLRFYHKSSKDRRVSGALRAFLAERAGEWAHRYCGLLRKNNELDFEDLICHVHKAMKNDKFREEWRKRFSYIIVDEMQDTSDMEYDIIRCLFQGNHSMMCGDYFQTIYEWRGTNPGVILKRYTEEFDPLRIYYTHNYRSTRNLCSASFGYLKNAFPGQIDGYFPPEIHIESAEEGSRILHVRTSDTKEEARLITEYLKKTAPENPSGVCVLSRVNRNIADLYTALMEEKKRNPHDYRFFTVDEERRFSRKAVIKDVLAFPRVLLSERTDETSFARICKKQVRGIGEQTVRAIQEKGTIGLSLTSFIQKDTFSEGDPCASLIRAAENGGIVVYDTETTGLDPGKDQVLQIAAIRMDADGNILESMNRLVVPTVPISKGALATHHKTMEEILAEGIEAKEALLEFSRFAEGKVIVGHNSVRFDLPLIRRQMKDCGLPELNVLGHYDTMLMARQFIPKSRNYKLATLCEPFGIVNDNAHDALGDIRATGRLLYRLIRDYVLPTREERMAVVRKYRDRFEPVIQLFDRLEYDRLRNEDFAGLIDQIIPLYHYENCEKETDREALAELREYVGALPSGAGTAPLREFLSDLNLSGSQMDTLIQKMRKVPIITVHQSKGCEFDTVIIADALDGTFPSGRSREDGKEPEERRLFYVAISRAKKNLMIISPVGSGRRVSPYIRFIPGEFMIEKDWKL